MKMLMTQIMPTCCYDNKTNGFSLPRNSEPRERFPFPTFVASSVSFSLSVCLNTILTGLRMYTCVYLRTRVRIHIHAHTNARLRAHTHTLAPSGFSFPIFWFFFLLFFHKHSQTRKCAFRIAQTLGNLLKVIRFPPRQDSLLFLKFK